MLVHNSLFRLRGFACVIAILIVCSSTGYGSNKIEAYYESGIKGIRDDSRHFYGNPIKNTKRSTVNSTSVGLWFGPRLGKRRKSSEKAEINLRDVETIAEALNAGPWALISIPRSRRAGFDKRQTTQFTPRLGRELTEGIAFYDMSDKFYNRDKDEEEQRQQQIPPQPYFAPRLGRQLSFTQAPILARDLRNLFKKVIL